MICNNSSRKKIKKLALVYGNTSDSSQNKICNSLGINLIYFVLFFIDPEREQWLFSCNCLVLYPFYIYTIFYLTCIFYHFVYSFHSFPQFILPFSTDKKNRRSVGSLRGKLSAGDCLNLLFWSSNFSMRVLLCGGLDLRPPTASLWVSPACRRNYLSAGRRF